MKCFGLISPSLGSDSESVKHCLGKVAPVSCTERGDGKWPHMRRISECSKTLKYCRILFSVPATCRRAVSVNL